MTRVTDHSIWIINDPRIIAILLALLGRIALAVQVIPPTDTHFCIAWPVVCHIRAPCLNSLTDLDAIWQLHLWGPSDTLC